MSETHCVLDETRTANMKRALSPSVPDACGEEAVQTATKRNKNGKICIVTGCNTRASFGLPGATKIYCATHNLPGYVNLHQKVCGVAGCGKNPSCGYAGGKAEFCSPHKQPGMINVVSRRCSAESCSKHPSFGNPSEKATRCADHRLPAMIDVCSKRCVEVGCNSVRPTFDIPGGAGLYCAQHARAGMVNVRDKRCTAQGCESVNPVFGLIGGKGIRCSKHREADMIDVRSKRCDAPGCHSLTPRYGFLGGKGTRCATHIEVGMVNLSTPCSMPGCTKQPRFGYPGSKGERCATHKDDGMVDLFNRRCAKPGCDTQAVFGHPGGKAVSCVQHREPGMEDVRTKPCAVSGCTKQRTYGLPEGKAVVCHTHREEEMINLRTRYCTADGCCTRASYGVPGCAPTLCCEHKTKLVTAADGTVLQVIKDPRKRCHCKQPATHGIRSPERCALHSLPGDLNLVEQPCVLCGLVFRLDPVTRMCTYCDTHSAQAPRLAKQREIKQFLLHSCPGLPVYTSYDATPKELRQCSDRERPDFMWSDWDGDRAWALVLECDEDQHNTRAEFCECSRMLNITQDMGRYTLWIRYNPDSYKPAVPGQRQVSKPERLRELERHIRQALEVMPDPVPRSRGAVMRLFFDGYDAEKPDVEWMFI